MDATPTELIGLFETICCTAAIIGLFSSKQLRQFTSFMTLLCVRLFGDLILLALMIGSSRIIERHTAYKIYFYTYWISFVLEAVISVFVVLSIFRLAMAPLPGLRKLGMLVFHWAAAISVA